MSDLYEGVRNDPVIVLSLFFLWRIQNDLTFISMQSIYCVNCLIKLEDLGHDFISAVQTLNDRGDEKQSLLKLSIIIIKKLMSVKMGHQHF